MRCRIITPRIWVNMSAVIVHSTSVDSDRLIPRPSAFWIGGVPCRICISIGTASVTCAPASAAGAARRKSGSVAYVAAKRRGTPAPSSDPPTSQI